jgi:hypothetical protein
MSPILVTLPYCCQSSLILQLQAEDPELADLVGGGGGGGGGADTASGYNGDEEGGHSTKDRDTKNVISSLSGPQPPVKESAKINPVGGE